MTIKKKKKKKHVENTTVEFKTAEIKLYTNYVGGGSSWRAIPNAQ